MSEWIQSKHGDWDVDLEFGEYHETRVRTIFELEGKTIEVKADRAWHTTGNIAIEYRFRGRPSGLSTTEAKWWLTVLTNKENPKESDMMILWSVSKLRAHLKKIQHKLRKVNAGHLRASKVLLVPLRHYLPALNITKH
jgi:transposase